MAEIKNPMAYFSTVIRNFNKNDYRSNDNFYKHISSVGDEHDIQDKQESMCGSAATMSGSGSQ